ncbi:lectin C-type domain protein [Cooperia oncophora]
MLMFLVGLMHPLEMIPKRSILVVIFILMTLLGTCEASKCQKWKRRKGGACYKVHFFYISRSQLCYEPTTFIEAERQCRRARGHLASIHNAKEMHFVFEMGRQYRVLAKRKGEKYPPWSVWIGMAEIDHVWQWTDDSVIDFFECPQCDSLSSDEGPYCAFVRKFSDYKGFFNALAKLIPIHFR